MRFALLGGMMALALVTGCTKPTDTVIPSDMSKWDTELAPALRKLPEEDRKLVAAYLVRAKLMESLSKEPIPIGITVGDVLAKQKQWQAEEEKKAAEAKALKEKLDREQQEARLAMSHAVTVTFLSKRQIPKNWELNRYRDVQQLSIGVENKSDKEIVGVSGELHFIDVFDKDVGSVNFGISERIKPGGTFRWAGERQYNEFVESHKAIWNLEDGKYTTRFVPEAVVFADGSKLTAPKN